MFHINFVAVLVAAVVSFVMGFMIHGPFLGKLWMRLAGIVPTGQEKMSDMYGQMFMNFVANIASATVIATIYTLVSNSIQISTSNWCSGVVVGLLVWVIQVTSTSMDVIWMKGNKKLWLFEVVSSFFVFAVMGIIIAVM